MSSDSDNAHSLGHHTYKRKKIVIRDSSDSSSDESLTFQTRRRKKILVRVGVCSNCCNIF